MSNEDLYALRQLVTAKGSDRLGAWTLPYSGMDVIAQVGVGKDTNLSALGAGDAILVIASNLLDEAPIWYLRLKQAHDRGAYVVVANARPTKFDEHASEHVNYQTGYAVKAMLELGSTDAGEKLAAANNLVIVAGAEGLTLEGSRALMQAAANFLIRTGHVGKPNNGLLATLPGANSMGLHYMGFTPEAALDIMQNPPKVLILAQADVYADDQNAAAWLSRVETVISLSLFPDEATTRAQIALPVQSFAERDGTFTNGERRVQRFYTAQGPMGAALPAWQVISRIGEKAGVMKTKTSAAAVVLEITQTIPAFAGMRYHELAKVDRQYPDVGGDDLYYGGTAYKNSGGLGIQIATAADLGESMAEGSVTQPTVPTGGLLVVPITRLYNREWTFRPSEAEVMAARVDAPYVEINSADAASLQINDGDPVEVSVNGQALQVRARVDERTPQGAILVPRHLIPGVAVPISLSVGQVSRVAELVR
jgi:NADH-quinone oxidoreductase subunit G